MRAHGAQARAMRGLLDCYSAVDPASRADAMNAPPRNPYAAPAAVVSDIGIVDGQAEQVRAAHLRHEVALKSVGSLYWFGCLMLVVGSAGMLAALVVPGGSASSTHTDALAVIVAVYCALAVLFGVLGYGFRRLRPWIRIPATLVAVPGLFAIPLGTLIQAYILYLMFSAKGRVVLGSGYAGIVAATPHLRYRRTVGDWIALAIVVALIVGGVAFFAMIGGSR